MAGAPGCGRPGSPCDALGYRGDDVSLVAVAPGWYLPVVAGDHLAAGGGAAPAGHLEGRRDGLGCVVDCEFFTRTDVAAGGEGVRTAVPQVRVAAVVAVVDGLAGREDQVGIVVDADGVQVPLAGRGVLHQLAKLVIGNQPASESSDGDARCEGLGGIQAAPVDG